MGNRAVMYFILPENLPTSVLKAAFEFISEDVPSLRITTSDIDLSNQGISIAIPDEISHVRSIRFTTSLNHFIYYYPGKGYEIAKGIHLPLLEIPAVGDYYAGGIVIQSGAECPNLKAEPDILIYKGSIMSLHEQTFNYYDSLIHCETISDDILGTWHLPDMLNLTTLYSKQQELNLCLAKQQGTMLYDEEYWCKDNAMIDLGVTFNMGTGTPDICPKKEKRQVRAILDY